MKNSDRTASPVECCIIDNSGDYIGLTKREHFAVFAMQGYISGQMAWSDCDGGGVSPSYEEVASEAVSFADALLAELEK